MRHDNRLIRNLLKCCQDTVSPLLFRLSPQAVQLHTDYQSIFGSPYSFQVPHTFFLQNRRNYIHANGIGLKTLPAENKVRHFVLHAANHCRKRIVRVPGIRTNSMSTNPQSVHPSNQYTAALYCPQSEDDESNTSTKRSAITTPPFLQ